MKSTDETHVWLKFSPQWQGKFRELLDRALSEARGGPRRRIVIACGSPAQADAAFEQLGTESDITRSDRRGREHELVNLSILVVLGGDELERTT